MNKLKPSNKPVAKPFSDLAPKSKRDALGLEQSAPKRRGSRGSWILISVMAFAWAAGVAALTISPLVSIAHSKAASLDKVAEAIQNSNPDQALLDYRMAHVLDPGNPTYISRMADLYLLRQQPDDAINALMQLTPEQAGKRVADIQYHSGRFEDAITTAQVLIKLGHADMYLLQAKSFLELNELDQAETVSQKAQMVDSSREEGIVLQAASEKLAGKAINIPNTSVGSLERLQQLTNIKTGGLPLAQSLYVLGLLRSSERVLSDLPANNTQRFALLANIKLAQQPTGKDSLLAAADALRQAVLINPSDLQIHQQLHDVYEKLGDEISAKAEADLIKRLQTGAI